MKRCVRVVFFLLKLRKIALGRVAKFVVQPSDDSLKPGPFPLRLLKLNRGVIHRLPDCIPVVFLLLHRFCGFRCRFKGEPASDCLNLFLLFLSACLRLNRFLRMAVFRGKLFFFLGFQRIQTRLDGLHPIPIGLGLFHLFSLSALLSPILVCPLRQRVFRPALRHQALRGFFRLRFRAFRALNRGLLVHIPLLFEILRALPCLLGQ